ncbi:unnamed protein product [Caenorhabditis sp. 36 PRJEB53466]|nr:unnamed protein product [Caenorhabditis sp. 36 PRJEB53466]
MPDNDERSVEIGGIVGKRYKVISKLGEGGMGKVFKVEDVEAKGTFYALKMEKNNVDWTNVLKLEVQVLSQLASKSHVAKCIASGKRTTFQYMVMTLLGESLESILDKHQFLNVSSQMRVGICILFGIKQIHDIGYLHRDLKPANVALGHKGSADERFFLIFDFGLARQYITDEKKMRRPRAKMSFRGTARYCSIAMHDNYEQGRVDDLWALVYLLADIRARLPWDKESDVEKIGDIKKTASDELLFLKSPLQMLEFVRIIRNTHFYDHPDYEKLFKLMEDVMKKAEYKWSDPYHWEPEKKKKKEAKSPGMIEGLITSLKSTKKKSGTALTPKGMSPTGTIEEHSEAPYFTADDFKSNPIGF